MTLLVLLMNRARWLLTFMTLAYSTGTVHALELEGYAEPYRTINVASDETGMIDEVLVREGEAVDAGQPIARLNSDIYQALLAIAEQNMQAQGQLDAAKANLEMREERWNKFRSLREEGHARQEEVDRAAAEYAVAAANLRSTQEDLVTRRLEYEKIATQIQRRTIRAPLSGVVTVLHRDKGEFVAPNSPDILTLVQIDTLLANFTLTSSQASDLKMGEELEVHFLDSDKVSTGLIEYISPVTDAESGTVLVKVRVDNSDSALRSGERCRVRIRN